MKGMQQSSQNGGDYKPQGSVVVNSTSNEAIDPNAEKASFLAHRVFITDEFQEPERVVMQGDRIIASRRNVITVTGKPKAFKTFLTSSIAAGFLEDDVLGLSGSGGVCLFIDTEQSKAHVNVVQKRIYRLCGWNTKESSDKLIMLSLRELNAEDRKKVIFDSIKELKPDLVIIDGIRDAVKDFNDLKESAEIVGELMSSSTEYNCAIVTVLHQNKSDNNARGHLGSELCNKSETVLQVVNESGIATVSPVYSRNREIEPFSFRINNEGLPEGCHIPKVEKKFSELLSLMSEAMEGALWMQRTDLTKKVELMLGKSYRTAERWVKDALDKGVIKFNKAGCIIMTNQLIEPDELPF